jgi:hypothetical protein
LVSDALTATDARREITGETIVFSPSLFLSIDSTSAADCFAAATISIPPALLDPIADEFAGQGQIPKDLVFRRLAQSPGGSSAAVSEAGLAELESIDLAGNPDYVIAMDNWPLMLRIQFRHFRSSLKALPIVVWWDDGNSRTRSAWSMLGSRQIVFWNFAMDHRMLLQAVETDGLISLAGPEQPTPESVSHYLRLHPNSGELQQTICRQAKPWPEALNEWIDQVEEGQVDDLFLQLDQAGADIGYILRRCDRPGLSRKWERVGRSIHFGRGIIRETPDGWVEEFGKGTVVRNRICNAMLRITHVIKDEATGSLHYQGDVRYKGEAIPFVELAETVRKKTATWLEGFLMEHGLGMFVCRPKFSRRLYDIAISFYEPAMVIDDVAKWIDRLPYQQANCGGTAPDSRGSGLLSRPTA